MQRFQHHLFLKMTFLCKLMDMVLRFSVRKLPLVQLWRWRIFHNRRSFPRWRISFLSESLRPCSAITVALSVWHSWLNSSILVFSFGTFVVINSIDLRLQYVSDIALSRIHLLVTHKRLDKITVILEMLGAGCSVYKSLSKLMQVLVSQSLVDMRDSLHLQSWFTSDIFSFFLADHLS